MSKKNRQTIKMLSQSGSKHFYTSVKNKKNNKSKIQLKKFDPIQRKHVFYKEVKLNS